VTGSQKRKKQPPKPLLLTGRQRSHLRALAHSLQPVVQVGHGGLSDGLFKHADEALETHELIKVKVSSEAELTSTAAAEAIATATRSCVAQVIGRIAVLYRPHPREPRIQLPKARKVRTPKAEES
jgi:RNA-binding protein